MIKPRLWPRIEFFSSGGQESQCLRVIQQQPFNLEVITLSNSFSCTREMKCVCVCVCVCVLVVQSYSTLCESIDYNLPGSSVHGILQARILEWVAMPFSRGSSQPRDRTQVSHIAGRFFIIWATQEAEYHLSVEPKKYNRLMNTTKKKQIHRYREQTSGYQVAIWG